MAFFSLKPTGGPLPAGLGQKSFPIKRPVIITTGTVLPLQPTGGPLPAGLGQKSLPIKRSVIITTGTVLPLQVKSEKEERLEAPMNLGVSRRDMMIYLTAGALNGATDPVEARVVKPEIRRQIREKLEMLREKAGLSKLKNEKTSPEQPLAKEKKLSSFPPPKPNANSEEALVEARP